MEYGLDMQSKPILIPRRLDITGTAVGGTAGLAWTTRYAVAGLNGLGLPLVVDGVNEMGLAGGIFYFPGYAGYQVVSEGEQGQTLAPQELLTWMLTNYATIDEVRAALPTVKVAAVEVSSLKAVMPMHYVVHDAEGNSLVIEYVDGQLRTHDNPIGVITNAPTFDWHLTNLSNYVNLSPNNAPARTIGGLKLDAFGQGSGLVGMPGDFTPPARFVRAFVFSQAAVPGDDGAATVREAFHVLDNFDIPRGTVRGSEGGERYDELTQWTSASDLRNRVYYFHTLDNRCIRRFELLKANLDGPQVIFLPTAVGDDVQDIAPPVTED